jgi:hypothetical protein
MRAHAIRPRPSASRSTTPGAHAYKRRTPPLHLVHAKSSCPPVSRCTRPFPFSLPLISATMAHCFPFFSCRSRSTVVPRSCSLTPRSVAFDTGEPPCHPCAGELPPRCRPSSSVHFQGCRLAALLCLGPWMHLVNTFPPTVQPPAISTRAARSVHRRCATAGITRALLAMWAVTWTIHALRYRLHRARPRPMDRVLISME